MLPSRFSALATLLNGLSSTPPARTHNNGKPVDLGAVLLQAEEELKQKMMGEAVTQRFNGSLVVDPNKVYVGRKEGQRALDRLRDWSQQKNKNKAGPTP